MKKDKNELICDSKTTWGGSWTEKKLNAFIKYVKAYLKIMNKNKYWKTIYFDGFAGSGNKENEKVQFSESLFISLEEMNYKGAAERVISISDSKFDYYYFIDTNSNSLNKLELKLKSLPESENKNLIFKKGDANKWILELSKTLNTKKYAALIFLDPFGMQINWESIESLTGTRSDIWILVPTGVIINRLLDRNGKLKNLKKLETYLGLKGDEIRSIFYKTEESEGLFGTELRISKINDAIYKISEIYIGNLKRHWQYVSEKPLILCNTKKVPLFHFVFASNNKSAHNIAQNIIFKN